MNKKGFVLIETLVVTIFTMFIFTILYNSIVPLLGKYKELSYYDDVDTTYDLYYLRNMIINDDNFSIIKESDYQKITCEDLENSDCTKLYNFLDIKSTDEVLFLNTNNIDSLRSDENISIDTRNYLKYIDTDNTSILLLNKNDYLSYINISTFSEIIIDKVKNRESYIQDDEIIYISGKKDDYNETTTDDIDFNYVWYSGKLWRVTAIYPDGSIKMITDDMVTSISFGATSTVSSSNTTSAYSTSWIREWLNQEFLPTLYNYENIIETDAGWYSITSNRKPPMKPIGNYTLTDPIGLLNNYEYYKSYEKLGVSATAYKSGYLNIGYNWWLLTPYDTTSLSWYVYQDGEADYYNPRSGLYGVRPVVKLKSTVRIKGGDGSYKNPYIIIGDKEGIVANKTLLNTRSSGEYVKLENDKDINRMFRIVGTELVGEKLTTKLVLNDYVKENNIVVTKYFSNDNTYGGGTNNNYWDYYLNNTYLGTLNKNMLEKGTYYLGMYPIATSYKITVCGSVDSNKSVSTCIKEKNVVNSMWNGYVGLLRAGEMFASQTKDYTYQNASNIWLVNPNEQSFIWYVTESGYLLYYAPTDASLGIRPSINLTSSVVIKSGGGTERDPFIVGLET